MKLRASYQAGFTMMEIAIAIGVIAFALVAIMGVLPTGMHMQRDNRQDTIIAHDGAYLLEAMRTGAQDIPDLYQFVDAFNGQPNTFNNSSNLIRELMKPEGLDSADPNPQTNLFLFHSITGPAVMRSAGVPTFRYLVKTQVTPSFVNTNLPYADELEKYTYDVRLTFLWPVLPTGELADPAQKQVFRTVIAGMWSTTNMFNLTEFNKP